MIELLQCLMGFVTDVMHMYVFYSLKAFNDMGKRGNADIPNGCGVADNFFNYLKPQNIQIT
jgi:hypothetical protein